MKERWICFPQNVSPLTLMTPGGFQLNAAAPEELMVSARGRGSEGRNLNALG